MLLATAALAVGAGFLFVPGLLGPKLPPMPEAAQTFERQNLAPVLRRRIEEALDAQGLASSSQTRIVVAPQDCPAACDTGMDQGLCYCLRDEQRNCPEGWPLERGDSRSACASLPAQVLVFPDGDGPEGLTITLRGAAP
jgi:hypothetical protein